MAARKEASRARKVVRLDEWKAGREGKGHPPAEERMDPEADRKVSAAQCVAALGAFGPISGELISLLRLPEGLYSIGSKEAPSFSSDAGSGAEEAAGAMLFGYHFPKKMPDYSIHISSRGGSIFCTLVDKKRRIIVSEDIRGIYGGNGDWKSFENSLRRALWDVQQLESQGKSFSFVAGGARSRVLD